MGSERRTPCRTPGTRGSSGRLAPHWWRSPLVARRRSRVPCRTSSRWTNQSAASPGFPARRSWRSASGGCRFHVAERAKVPHRGRSTGRRRLEPLLSGPTDGVCDGEDAGGYARTSVRSDGGLPGARPVRGPPGRRPPRSRWSETAGRRRGPRRRGRAPGVGRQPAPGDLRRGRRADQPGDTPDVRVQPPQRPRRRDRPPGRRLLRGLHEFHDRRGGLRGRLSDRVRLGRSRRRRVPVTRGIGDVARPSVRRHRGARLPRR